MKRNNVRAIFLLSPIILITMARWFTVVVLQIPASENDIIVYGVLLAMAVIFTLLNWVLLKKKLFGRFAEYACLYSLGVIVGLLIAFGTKVALLYFFHFAVLFSIVGLVAVIISVSGQLI